MNETVWIVAGYFPQTEDSPHDMSVTIWDSEQEAQSHAEHLRNENAALVTVTRFIRGEIPPHLPAGWSAQ